jgi:RNA polymerase sigma factor (sigma-70 family)
MVEELVNTCAPDHATDEELVKLFLESDDNRHFQKLYERYALKVYQRCYSLTSDSCRAEDLTHDIFLKLMSKMKTFKEDAKFATWLFTITYNHCMDWMRTGKRRIVTIQAEHIEAQDDFDVHAIFDVEELDTTSLRWALTQLSLDEKAMIFLKYLDGHSIRYIATVFDTTESAVKMRLRRCREKLRKKYLESILFN